ncbi:MAG: TonB-dependent receptor family protein [Bacteroidia bacterium]|nr:TonB-dependent receptor family protein [Bacteroidia bacterium]
MVSLNVKEKPIGFSVVYTYHSLMNPVPGYSNRSNLYNGITTGYYNTYDHNRYQNSFQMGSASMDYYMNNHNTLSLSENYVTGTFDSYNNQTFETTDGARSVLTSGDRITNTNVRFVNYTTKLHHRKTFLKKGEELTADINYSIGSSKSPSSFTTYNYLSDGTLIADNPLLQHNDGTNQNTMLTIQSDFVNPINDSTKLELGLRSNYKPSYQALDIDTYDYSLNSYIVNQYLTSHYQIQDLVNAAYINYSMRYKKINYMLGLRFEESYYKGILTNRNDSSFHYSYPNALNNIMNAVFPSIFISKPFNDKQELQFNISRKINRPNFHQRMPFIMASDAKNYSIGNPSLTPEFITMGELNFNQTLNKGNLLFTFFARNTQSPITSYTYTSKADSSVLISTSINGKQSNTIGMDNTFKYTLFKNFETTFNMNLFYVFIDATYNSNNFSNKGFNYTTKLNMIYRLPKNFSLQLSGNYQSPKIIPQGKSSEIYFADCGLSKEIKKFITLTFSVSDIFNTKGRGTYINTDQYIQNSWGRRETRYVKFTAMIRFGKADASMFKRKKDHRQQDDQEDMGF